MTRIVDPPREVPSGLRLHVLGQGDVVRSLLFFGLAAAALLFAASHPGMRTPVQMGLLLVGWPLVLLGYYGALPGIARNLVTLRWMRNGFEGTGHIVACRLAGTTKRNDVPYREFLQDWLARTMRTAMGKWMGCFVVVILLVLVVPTVLTTVVLGVAVVANYRMLVDGGSMGGVTIRDAVTLIEYGLVFIVATVVMLRLLVWNTMGTLDSYVQWARTQGGRDPRDEARTLELVASAREQAKDIQLKDPLPKEDPGVELICRVDFSAMGELRSATGRVPLSDRLDLAGVERLLFDPLHPREVSLFVGLPVAARVNELGQWRDIPPGASGLKLAAVAAAAIVATAALVRDTVVFYMSFQ